MEGADQLRPWYVLGPGHRWPHVFLPFYWVCKWLPRHARARGGLAW